MWPLLDCFGGKYVMPVTFLKMCLSLPLESGFRLFGDGRLEFSSKWTILFSKGVELLSFNSQDGVKYVLLQTVLRFISSILSLSLIESVASECSEVQSPGREQMKSTVLFNYYHEEYSFVRSL